MSMGTAAFAASITINQPDDVTGTVGAETYNLYKIFDVTKTEAQENWKTEDDDIGPGTEEGFSYTISTSNPWFAKLGTVTEGVWAAASGQTWVTLTPSAGDATVYTVTYDSTKNTEAEAKAFAAWLYSQKGTIAADQTMESSSGSAVKANVADGYWLIDSSLGTALVLATSDIEITTKNQYVTDDKTVAKTNYNVGDLVDFTITVTLPATIDYTKPVIVHDTMDSVLALKDSSVSAKIGETAFTGITLVKSDSFDSDHLADHAAATGKTLFDFELDISSLAPTGTATAEQKIITITYQAELTSDAAADTGYVNEEFTEYSKYQTQPNDVEVKTYDFDLDKKFTGDEDNTDLTATFNLYPTVDSAKGTTAIQFVEETANTAYVKADSDDETTTATITVKQGTTVNVRGLEAGTYYLTEVSTETGYNALTDDIVITIAADGTYTATLAGTSVVKASTTGDGSYAVTTSKIEVVNNSGTVLPSTGGIGTTIFYVVGSILVVAAGVLLITKKRMSREG